MGEAKHRGTLEHRIAEAKIASAKKAEEARKRRLAEEASITPEQRSKRKNAKILLGTMLAMSAGLNQR